MLAWIRLYGQMGIIWYENENSVSLDAEKPDFREKSGKRDAALPICLATMVRRCTAATGE